MKKKATLKDVAQMAGVSSATVSYVLNNNQKQKISDDTRSKVFETARQLHYTPNTSAKSLKCNRTRCIGVAMDKDITIPRYAQTLQGIRHHLQENGYRILLCSTSPVEKDIPDFLSCYFSNQVDGLIYIGADSKSIDLDSVATMVQYSVPAVAFDCPGIPEISTVLMDYYTGALNMVEWLHRQGIQRMIYLRPSEETLMEQERELGALRAAAIWNISLQVVLIPFQHEGANMQLFQMGFSDSEKAQFRRFAKSIREEISPYLDSCDEETAIICSWSGMEQHVYPLVAEKSPKTRIVVLAQGILYPGSYPTISYSQLPNFRAGQECAAMVLQMIEHPQDIQHVVLTPLLEADR